MGANDAAEMLEVAKAECVRLEHELAEMQSLAQVNAMNMADYLAAIEDAKEARAALAAVQQPNRTELIEAAKQAWGNQTIMRRGEPHFVPPVSEDGATAQCIATTVDAILAALPIPATGEAESRKVIDVLTECVQKVSDLRDEWDAAEKLRDLDQDATAILEEIDNALLYEADSGAILPVLDALTIRPEVTP